MLQVGLKTLEHTPLTNYLVNKVIQAFGQAGGNSVITDIQQLNDRKDMENKREKILTYKERKEKWWYLIFPKKKIRGMIKVHGCVDGTKKIVYKTKYVTRSTTISTESLLLYCIIYSKERADVTICDTPGYFLQEYADKLIHLRVTGPLARLLTKVGAKLYEKYITKENGKPVIYTKLTKYLYVTLQVDFFRNI